MKKSLSLILSIICIITFLLFATASGSKKDDPKPEITTAINKPSETTAIVSETEKLSNNCDVILATGYDENGSLFELVGFEEEDYTGTTTKIGVIKDNVWLLEPTTDFPFINEGNLLLGRKSIYNLEYDEKPIYIGNGCFEYEYMIYNCNTDKTFDMWQEIVGRRLDGKTIMTLRYFRGKDCNQRNNMLILGYGGAAMELFGDDVFDDYQYTFHEYYMLNTLTMEFSSIPEGICPVTPCSEGLYAAKEKGKGGYDFYDTNNEKVIVLDYYIPYSSQLIFNDGKCIFNINNDQGTTYKLTIDKTGNILEVVEIE